MLRAYKYKLKPTKTQQDILSTWFGITRYIWNWSVTTNKNNYELYKQFIFAYDLNKYLPYLKQEHDWIGTVPSQILQNVVFDYNISLSKAIKNKKGFPKYKSKKNPIRSITLSQTNNHIKPNKTQIKIPKIGWIKWIKHRPLEGKLKTVTIKQENNNWYIICVCELPNKDMLTDVSSDKILGIDMGFKDFYTDNLGNKISTPKYYRKSEDRLKKKQRLLSRKKKASNNYKKYKNQLNKLYTKIRNQRYDFLHQISFAIAKQYDIIGVEDLNIAGMKKRYGKTINDLAWSRFINLLSYKSNMIKIDRYYPSSQICHSCGNKQKISLNTRIYDCNCGVSIDRDINAAINIRNAAINGLNRNGTIRIYACGDTNDEEILISSYVSMKQEKILTIGKEACGF